MWPEFESQTWHHLWIEFLGSLLWSKRFFSEYSSFPLSSKKQPKVAYYSFPKKKIKILKSVKLKKPDVSSEVSVTAINVKCNFTQQINANQGKMLNIVTELIKRGLKTRHFKHLFLKNKPYDPNSNFQDSLSEKKNNRVQK